jgi:lipoprotein-anchoring transpeptidase ErfK/SrfK
MYRRARRRGARRLIGVAGAVAVVAAVVWYLRPGSAPDPVPGGIPADEVAVADSADSPGPAPLGRPEDVMAGGARGVADAGGGASTPERRNDARPAVPSARPAPAPAPAPAPLNITRPAEPVVTTAAEVRRIAEAALAELDERPLAAREELSRLLFSGELGTNDAALVRSALSALNRELIFGMRFVEGDPYVESYRIRSGDALSQLPRRQGWRVGWRLIADIAGIRDPGRIQLGQEIKGLRGPFHAVVTKRAHRLDVWMGDLEASPVYVTSFDVGLGTDDGTPVGRWGVRSKDVNPSWRNPETGERFTRDDPENPIGERWIGIEGLDPANAGMQGFGIHGTIEPDSIGGDESMGCVRLRHDDIVRLYDLIDDDESIIVIRTAESDPILRRR